VCLLSVAFHVRPDVAVVVAGNRDERYVRPAEPMQVLRKDAPRTLGGRDVLAGGTWLAVNDAGVFAGITNRPSSAGRDPTRRSRGELQLMLTEYPNAREAARAFAGKVSSADYNPCWLLVGDRTHLFYISLGDHERPRIQELEPGIHVLENRPLEAHSPKAEMVRAALAPLTGSSGGALVEELHAVLRSHTQPPEDPRQSDAADLRRRALGAACVHTADYGTRSATIIMIPATTKDLPRVHYADGAPCRAPFVDSSHLWGL
jgi:uncharacterized protein with NRDE domain